VQSERSFFGSEGFFEGLPLPDPDQSMVGGYGAGDPPDPIPNSEVKTRCADGTAGATRWESTAPPTSSLDGTPVPSFMLGAGVSHLGDTDDRS
jgi:hypothetical protein